MAEANEESIWDIAARGLRNATNEELARLKGLSDNDMLRAAGSMDAFAIVESSRRLKNALQELKNAVQEEERAIRRLTRWLLPFTVAIFALTAVLVWLGWRA